VRLEGGMMITGKGLALLTHIYNAGYSAGHHDTVEATYTDILPVDIEEIHSEIVEVLFMELEGKGE